MATTEAGRRVTAADVARSLGVSRATVGFVLNRTPGQTISEATRRRVLAEAQRMGYRPHAGAQALARGRSNIALLVLPDWPVDFAMRVNLEEAGQLLETSGYTLVTQTRHGPELTRPLWEVLQPDVVLGMLPFSETELSSLRVAGVPRIIPDTTTIDPHYDVRGVDAGARAQVAHLHGLGHTRLGYAQTDDLRLAWLQAKRLEAAAEECELRGLRRPAAVTVGDHESAGAAIRSWRQQGVTGVLGYNDETAALVVGAAVRSGIEIPGQLAVVGHDDSPLARLLVPGLSSVRIDQASLGRYMAEIMLDAVGALDHPVRLPDSRAEVVRREST